MSIILQKVNQGYMIFKSYFSFEAHDLFDLN